MKKKDKKKRRIRFLDSHYKIERYGFFLVLFLCLMIISWGYSTIRHNSIEHARLMKVDSAGTATPFSQTKSTTLKLGKSRLSSDRKRAYIPISFNSMDDVGLKANDYKIFIAAADRGEMDYQTDGQFILYGSTGRGVLVLNSDKKIVSQPLDLFIVNKHKVTTLDEATSEQNMSNGADSSNSQDYGSLDVVAFKINPGAYDVTNRTPLNIKDNNLKSLYEHLYGTGDTSSVEKKIDADKKKIVRNEAAAKSLTEHLKDEGYDVPNAPDFTKDNWRPKDTVDLKTGKTKNGKDAIKYAASQASASDNGSENNGDSDSGQDQYPQSLKNKDGSDTTSTANGDAERSGSDTDAGGNAKDNVGGAKSNAATQWSQLQTAWNNIKAAKRDIYINQRAALYKIEKQQKTIMDQASVSRPDRFKQLDKLK